MHRVRCQALWNVRQALRVSAVLLAVLCLASVRPARAVCNIDPPNLDFQMDGLAGVDGLAGAQAVAVSGDGANVYVAGSNDDAVAVFARDLVTGDLTFLEREKNGVDDPTDGGPIVDGIDVAAGVAVYGSHVYVTGSASDALALFTRDAAGKLTFVERRKNNEGTVKGIDGASGIAVSADGKTVYVTGTVQNAVAVFSRDNTTGSLTWLERETQGFNDVLDPCGTVDGLTGAAAVAVNPDLKRVYVASKAGNALAVFRRDTTTGRLCFIEAYQDGVGGIATLASANAVAVSPDGHNIYVTASGSDDAVNVFVKEAEPSDELDFVTFVKDNTNGANRMDGLAGVAVDATGEHVYAVADTEDALTVFRRDGTSGLLSFDDDITDGTLNGARAVAVSPNRQTAYVAGFDVNSVTWVPTFDPVSVTCDDDDPCTVADHCDGAGTCVGGGFAAADVPCDDNNTCTAGDLCDGAGACTPGACSVAAACGCNQMCATVDSSCVCQ